MPRSKRSPEVTTVGTRPRESLKAPKPETRPVKVYIIESERGWGQKIDEVKEFDTLELAETFVTEYNSHNTEETVPDWYMRAEVVR